MPPGSAACFTLQADATSSPSTTAWAASAPRCWANRLEVGPWRVRYLQVRGVLPQLLGDRRPGDGRGRAGQRGQPGDEQIRPGPKATKALYPDDPSNVYHSYMRDHVKFRILHAGTNITHVHHQHAHQWLHSPNNDTSHYRDSQMISPGAAYTLELIYHGQRQPEPDRRRLDLPLPLLPALRAGHVVALAGARRVRGGHGARCQKRPLRRTGTARCPTARSPPARRSPPWCRCRRCRWPRCRPRSSSRGDVPGGTGRAGYRSKVDWPIPTSPTGNPGYPFFIPGIGGQRAPHPPLDFAPDDVDAANQIPGRRAAAVPHLGGDEPA